MARGDVARLCKVGEGKTSSGRNSGSSAKRSSKYTSDSTLPDQQGHTHKESIYTHALHRWPPPRTHTKGLNSLVHGVKGLLERRRARFQLLGCRRFFVRMWRWQVGFRGGCRREERRRREAFLPSGLQTMFTGASFFSRLV